MTLLFDRPITILTVACEASSESEECQQAIVASIRNRVLAGRWEKSMAGVCMQRYQYSEFLPDAGDNADLERVLALPNDSPELAAAMQAYDAVTADQGLDPSQGSTHFYADGIPMPSWARAPAMLAVKIGRVNFWKGVA